MFSQPVQVSALDQELIEVDPDTKEMLKLLVSSGSIWLLSLLFWSFTRNEKFSMIIIKTAGPTDLDWGLFYL